MKAQRPLKPGQARRLRAIWRSAGWPVHDALEAELRTAGWVQARQGEAGHETLELTPEGVAALAAATEGHRRSRDAHESLVERVAVQLQREGRLVWAGLSLRAGLEGSGGEHGEHGEQGEKGEKGEHGRGQALRWVMAQPDLFSLRPSTTEAGLSPLAHEIKAHRSDLLGDLRRPDKAAAYRALAGACWYVLGEGVGDADDVPPPFGVMTEQDGRLLVQRPPERRAVRLGLPTWLALARATPRPPDEAAGQLALGADPLRSDPPPSGDGPHAGLHDVPQVRPHAVPQDRPHGRRDDGPARGPEGGPDAAGPGPLRPS